MTELQRAELFDRFQHIINFLNLENESRVSDYISADFLIEQFESFNKVIHSGNISAFLTETIISLEQAKQKLASSKGTLETQAIGYLCNELNNLGVRISPTELFALWNKSKEGVKKWDTVAST